MTELFICNLQHICERKTFCIHARPHGPLMGKHCGPAMSCNGSDVISWCVPVNDDIYYEKRIITYKKLNVVATGCCDRFLPKKEVEK